MKLDNVLGLKIIFTLTVLATAALAYCAVSSASGTVLTIILVCIVAILLWLLWRGFVKPRQMVHRGMELLSAQETNNRLALVNQPDADRIARLFNTLMERLHSERLRLREQNSFREQLIKASPMGIAMMDFDANITDVNPAFRKLAFIPDAFDPEGKKFSELPGHIAAQMSEMKDGEIKTIKFENRVLRSYALSFMDSGFKRPFVLLESLTDEVINAERKAYDKVIRLMAHEVNNSMTGITTLLEVLSSYHKNDPEMSVFIESVSERCQSMRRFISAYADVVRLPEPVKKQIDLGKFISSQLPFLRSNSRNPIEYAEPEETLLICADADMLAQALVNIIKNSSEAIDATGREDGLIIISAERIPHEGCRITICDNGCGITDEIANELFNPFFTTKTAGQGIGLTTVAEILRRHDSHFSLRTDPDGLTHFRILLK